MKFYRYVSWNGESGAYVRENLLANAVYLASPKSFNDPFDFNPVYAYDGTKDQMLIHFAHLLRDREGLTKKEARAKAKRIVSENPMVNSAEGLKSLAETMKETIRGDVGVACFTTKLGNSPMWAHYADGHTGICLEWDFPEADKKEYFLLPQGVKKIVPLSLFPVKYSNERAVNYLFEQAKQSEDSYYNSIFTKSTDWAYENEYRLIQPGYTKFVYYEPCRLTGIYIGCKASQKQIEEVEEFVNSMTWQPRLYKTKLNDKLFEYDVIPLR